MSKPKRHDSPVLQTLERHRAVLVQEARTHQARSEALLAKAEAAYSAAESRLESALAVQRRLGECDTPIPAHALQWAHQYAHSQLAALPALQDVCDHRRSDLTVAQDELAGRLKDLKTIERLRQRLRQACAKWQLRQDQSRLDGLGIIKGVSGEATWP